MAYLYKSGNNTYFRVVINRKGIKVDKLFHSAKEANRFQIECKEAIDNGTYQSEDLIFKQTPTITDLLDDYYNLILCKKNKDFVAYKDTRKSQRSKVKVLSELPVYINNMVVYHKIYEFKQPPNTKKLSIETDEIPFGYFLITSVDKPLIEAVIKSLYGKGLKEGSVRTYLKVIKSAFQYVKWNLYPELMSSDIIVQNPFEDFTKDELPKNSRARKTIVSDEEIQIALNFFSKPSLIHYKILLLIALQTGLRKTESVVIKKCHIKECENGATIFIPKSKNGLERTVFINQELYSLIKEHLLTKNTNSDRLFQFSVSAVNQAWIRAFEAVKRKNPVWHTLKNTAITKAIQKNDSNNYIIAERFNIRASSVEEIKESISKADLIRKLQNGEKLNESEISFLIGGHSSINMTQQYFVDTTTGEKQ